MKHLLDAFQTTGAISRNKSKPKEVNMKTNRRICLGPVLAAGVILAQSVLAAGPAPLNLLSTARFTILSGAAITTTHDERQQVKAIPPKD